MPIRYSAPVSRSKPPVAAVQPREIEIVADDLRQSVNAADIAMVVAICSNGKCSLTRELAKLLKQPAAAPRPPPPLYPA
jgi:hypothetical protein